MANTIEHASELRGVLLVAREEGAQLGTVTGINVNPDSKQIAAIRFRPKTGRKEAFVLMADVQLIGRDVVLVSSEIAVKPIEDDITAPGKNLEELQGAWVTTTEGKHLGTLVDVDFRPRDWLISELDLSDGKSLEVDPTELRIGDEVIVPASYAKRVKEAPKQPGVMSRIFGADTMEQLKGTLTRALRGQDSGPDKPAS